MKQNTFRYLRRVILACLLAFVLATRLVPYGGEFYATYFYPTLSHYTSLIASYSIWSLEEITVILGLVILLLYPLIASICRLGWVRILFGEIEWMLWFFVWFYLGWGCNYYRTEFHERLMIQKEAFDEKTFQQFLFNYTDSLNASYVAIKGIEKPAIRKEIKRIYATIPAGYGLAQPQEWQQPKKLFFNNLYASVGVLGYMGPFFAETQLNAALLPTQYAFTYAHELAHLLGISSEAEANFWAFSVCTHSAEPAIKYSGYLGILPLVMHNANKLLSKEDFKEWVLTLEPVVIEDREKIHSYWAGRYNPTIGELQNKFYNLFLKSNRIATGTKNYAEVVQMLVSVEQSKCKPLQKEGTRLSVKQ